MKQFSQKLAKELAGVLSKNASVIASIKEAGDVNGTFRVVATTQGKDRDGEIVLQEGLDVTNFLKNPVILFGHDYWSLPIGVATKVEKNSETGQTIIEGVFASEEANPKAQQVRRLYDAGMLKAVSIGFIAKNWEGNVITESELLELSFVPVPANADALDIAKSAGLIETLKAFLDDMTAQKLAPQGVFAKFYEDAKHSAPTQETEVKTEDQSGTVESEEEEPKPEETPKPKPEEDGALSNEDIKKSFASFDEKLDNIVNELKAFSGIQETLKSVEEKLVGISSKQKENVSQEEAPESDEAKGVEELQSILSDVQKQTQLIDRVVGNINKTLKTVKK